jgi:hypothetical protein
VKIVGLYPNSISPLHRPPSPQPTLPPRDLPLFSLCGSSFIVTIPGNETSHTPSPSPCQNTPAHNPRQ